MTKNKKFTATKRELQAKGLWFTQKEVRYLVSGAKKIGFIPIAKYVKDKKFDPKKVEGHIDFSHKKTEEYFRVDKFEIKHAGLNFNDKVVDIFFTLLFKKHADEIDAASESF